MSHDAYFCTFIKLLSLSISRYGREMKVRTEIKGLSSTETSTQGAEVKKSKIHHNRRNRPKTDHQLKLIQLIRFSVATSGFTHNKAETKKFKQ